MIVAKFVVLVNTSPNKLVKNKQKKIDYILVELEYHPRDKRHLNHFISLALIFLSIVYFFLNARIEHEITLERNVYALFYKCCFFQLSPSVAKLFHELSVKC